MRSLLSGDAAGEVRRAISGGSSLWVGAASFEKRCTASLMEIAGESGCPIDGLVLDYLTRVDPVEEGEALRARYRQQLLDVVNVPGVRSISTRDLAPYVFADMGSLLIEICHRYDSVILDLTCLTKIHTIAVAAFIGQGLNRRCQIFLAYTVPENYGFLDETLGLQPAWEDIIIAPMAETATLLNESSGQGIVIPGHESYRLIVATGEIDPAGGLILLSRQTSRPDLYTLMVRRNRRLLGQLTRMRLQRWATTDVSVTQPEIAEAAIFAVIDAARERSAPVIVFPFGPKPIIYYACYAATRRYPDSSWFVYPVPLGYDVNYSFGIDRVLWFGADQTVPPHATRTRRKKS